MDKEYEYQIVKTFFNKHYQDRIIFELSSKKKRKDAIKRLSHDYENILEKKLMQETDSSDLEEIYRLLNVDNHNKLCYIISFYKEVDGKYLPLHQSLDSIFYNGMPSLVIWSLQLAYFQGEQVIGPTPRYILKK